MPSMGRQSMYMVLSLVTIGILILCLYCRCRSNINNQPVATVQVDTSWSGAIGRGPTMIPKLMSQDSALYQIVNSAVLGIDPSHAGDSLMSDYLSDSSRMSTRDTAARVFRGFHWQQALGPAFSRYQTSFPDQDIPRLYTLITDFNYGLFHFQAADGHDAMGIGLEMFLDKPDLYDRLSIANPNFSNYLNRTFNLQHLPSKIMYALAHEVVVAPSSNRLLDNILSQGKQIYLVKKWMPDLEDTLLLEYTAPQVRWVRDNELDIWRFLLTDRLIYKVSGQEVANLVQPSPHSQGMPQEAPGRAVNYIGWKIIEAYMKKSGASDMNLAEEQDFDKILKVARYRPD